MPDSWRNHSDAPPSLVVQTLIRSTDVEVQHWARVAHGNLEAAAALGPLVAFCAADTAFCASFTDCAIAHASSI